jgi:hypothetical protein
LGRAEADAATRRRDAPGQHVIGRKVGSTPGAAGPLPAVPGLGAPRSRELPRRRQWRLNRSLFGQPLALTIGECYIRQVLRR